MNVRGTVKVLVMMYLNAKRLQHAPVKDVAKEINACVKGIDAYRVVYGLGLKDPAYSIEKDEDTTYIRRITA